MQPLYEVLDRFEECWQSDERPKLRQFLQEFGNAESSALPHGVLDELVKIDLEYRWKTASDQASPIASTIALVASTRDTDRGPGELPERPMLDDYVRCLPELGGIHHLALEMLVEEYRVRHRWGDQPSQDEYFSRFPRQRQVLADALAEMDRRLEYELRPSTQSSAQSPGFVFAKTTLPQPPVGDKYMLKQVYAEGGLGRVWLAADTILRRDVALKEVRPDRAAGADARKRLVNEAKITGQLEHPNIVPVYELSESADDDRVFYTMRLVQGQTLEQSIKSFHDRSPATRSGSLELSRLLAAFTSICNAVAYAHSRGVIHRDLKPVNVVLGEFGEVIVLDWGLAKHVGGCDELASSEDSGDSSTPDRQTLEGTVLGSLPYMAPEQAAGNIHEIGFHTDVYGLGAILFQILTGQPPYLGDNRAQLLTKIADSEPPEARKLDSHVPRPLNAICLRAMAAKPRERYATARELAEDVQSWLADQPIRAYRDSISQKIARWTRRHRTWTQAGAVALLIVLIVSFARAAAEFDDGSDRKRNARFAAEMLARGLRLRAIAEHPDIVLGARFLDGGNRIASWSKDGSLRIWKAETGTIDGSVDPEEGELSGEIVQFDPRLGTRIVYNDFLGGTRFTGDESRVLAWGRDGRIRLLEIKTGKLLTTVEHARERFGFTRASAILGAIFNADESRVLSWDREGDLLLWETGSGKILRKFTTQTNAAIVAAGFYEGEKDIWCLAQDGRIWSVDVQRDDHQQTAKLRLANDTSVLTNAIPSDKQGRRVLAWDDTGTAWLLHSGNVVAEVKHPSPVLGAVSTESGDRVLTWCSDGTARVWESSSGKMHATADHKKSVWGAVFSGDESRVLSWSTNGRVLVWDAMSGEVVAQLDHEKFVTGAVLSKDATRVLSWSMDGAVRVWSVESGDVIQEVRHDHAVKGAFFNGDERNVLSWSADGVLWVWDVDSGERLGEACHGDLIWGAALNQDESQVLSWSFDGSVRLWNLEPRYLVEARGIRGAEFSHDGRKILVWNGDGKTLVRDSHNGDVVVGMKQATTPLVGATFSKDAARILGWHEALEEEHGLVRIWDASSGEVLAEVSHSGSIRGAAYDRNGERVLSWSADGSVKLWEAVSGKAIRTDINHGRPVAGAVFVGDDKFVLSWDDGGQIWFWETRNGGVGPVPKYLNVDIEHIDFSPDGTRAFTARDALGELWAADTGEVLAEIDVFGGDAVFSSDGSLLVVWDKPLDRDDGMVRVIDSKSGKTQNVIPHQGAVALGRLSVDNELLLTLSRNGILRIYKLAGSELLVELVQPGHVLGARWIKHGRVVSWSSNGSVWIWDSESGDVLADFKHGSSIAGVELNKNEGRLLTWDSNLKLTLTNLATDDRDARSPLVAGLELRTGTKLDIKKARPVTPLSRAQWLERIQHKASPGEQTEPNGID